MEKQYDIVIFGATGYTGSQTLEALLELCCSKQKSLKIAIAGRNRQKLQETLEIALAHTGMQIKVPVLIASAEDEESLREMAKQTKLVINCCGPFVLYGESVVKACILERSHHIDVTAEDLYIQQLYLKYDSLAKENGVYVVTTCGYDCVPTDMGVVFLQNNFPGTLNSVELYMQLSFKDKSRRGAIATMGSWKSMVHHLSDFWQVMRLQSRIKLKGLPVCEPKLPLRLLPHTPHLIGKPAIYFPSWDKEGIARTQAYLCHTENKRPVQANVYFVLGSYFAVFLLMFGAVLWEILSLTKLTRNLLIKHPKLFTLGYVRREDPTEEVLDNCEFRFTLFGSGWKSKSENANKLCNIPPDESVIGCVSGVNPYKITSVSAALCAKIIINETDRLPTTGGVFSPGAAFSKTSLINQLNENGMKFEILPVNTRT